MLPGLYTGSVELSLRIFTCRDTSPFCVYDGESNIIFSRSQTLISMFMSGEDPQTVRIKTVSQEGITKVSASIMYPWYVRILRCKRKTEIR